MCEVLTQDDQDVLATALDVVLELFELSEQRVLPNEADERDKQRSLKMERRRYKELRAKLDPERHHGMPVLRESLYSALGVVSNPPEDIWLERNYHDWLLREEPGPLPEYATNAQLIHQAREEYGEQIERIMTWPEGLGIDVRLISGHVIQWYPHEKYNIERMPALTLQTRRRLAQVLKHFRTPRSGTSGS